MRSVWVGFGELCSDPAKLAALIVNLYLLKSCAYFIQPRYSSGDFMPAANEPCQGPN